MGSKLQTIRAFVAVNLSMDTLRALGKMQQEIKGFLRSEGIAVRWVPPVNMHQTVKFIGDVDRELVEGISDALEEAGRDFSPFTVEAVGFGAFPDPKRPRVLWAGLRDETSGLSMLQKAVEDALEELGIGRESRPFRTHVTLGRVKKGYCDVSKYVEDYAETTHGISMIGELILYESRLLRSGADYVALARVELSGEEAESAASEKGGIEPSGLQVETEEMENGDRDHAK